MVSNPLKYGALLTATLLVAACARPQDDTSYQQFVPQQNSAAKPDQDITGSVHSYRAYSTVDAQSEWERAYAIYQEQSRHYWDQIAEMRKVRNAKRRNGQALSLNDYVLTHPPVYNGPPRPASNKPTQTPSRTAQIPGVDDFLSAAKKVYNFTPERATNEFEFMQAYARTAQQIGLTGDQLVAIYAFETGGDGTHDLQAGMLPGRQNARPISTAMGYNQLVATASVSVMWEFGGHISRDLRQQAAQNQGARRASLLRKAEVVEAMTANAKTVPHQWSKQAELAKTPMGMGIHAALLDKDIGPLLQIQKLRTSLNFLHARGVKRRLTGAELEMLNLTGDGNGYDMVTMPAEWRDKVPTANFFVRNGYVRNPVATRNNTVAALLAATEQKMQNNMQKSGAQTLKRAFAAQN